MSDVQKPAGLPVLLVVLTITTGLIDAIRAQPSVGC